MVTVELLVDDKPLRSFAVLCDIQHLIEVSLVVLIYTQSDRATLGLGHALIVIQKRLLGRF
jgi:hypothetical protein